MCRSVERGRVSAAAERWRETKRSPFDLFGHSERDKWGELAGGLVELTLVSTHKKGGGLWRAVYKTSTGSPSGVGFTTVLFLTRPPFLSSNSRQHDPKHGPVGWGRVGGSPDLKLRKRVLPLFGSMGRPATDQGLSNGRLRMPRR